MFSKTADQTATPTRPTIGSGGANATRSVLSADLRVIGEITSTGIIEVLGEIDGTVTAHGLVVGGEGRGLKVALTTLNAGRLSIPAASIGLAKRCLQICDRGYVLDQGRNAYSGTGRELADDPKVIELYLGTLAKDVEGA